MINIKSEHSFNPEQGKREADIPNEIKRIIIQIPQRMYKTGIK